MQSLRSTLEVMKLWILLCIKFRADWESQVEFIFSAQLQYKLVDREFIFDWRLYRVDENLLKTITARIFCFPRISKISSFIILKELQQSLLENPA